MTSPVPRWQAYRDLFALVCTENTWKHPELVARLNKDAKKRDLPTCTYCLRDLAYYAADPQSKKRSSIPSRGRLEHLYEWLREQLELCGKTANYASRLKAIAPPPPVHKVAPRPTLSDDVTITLPAPFARMTT